MPADEPVDIARLLQQGLLPTAVPRIAGLLVTTQYHSGGRGDVGGDWYDVLDLPDGGVAFVIGDVAGHGLGAAMSMAQLRHGLRAYLLDDRSPGSALAKLNRLTEWALPGEVATTLVAVFESEGDDVRIASAGHLPPLVTSAHRTAYLAVETAPALGVTSDVHVPETVARVDEGEALILFTDGLVERRGEPIDDGLERLASACRDHRDGDLLEHLVSTVPDSPSDDDVAAIAIRRAETA